MDDQGPKLPEEFSRLAREDMPFVFPDLNTGAENQEQIPLGSGYITSLLGKGGMANVYEIWNPNLEVYRAVKLIHPSATDTDKDRFDTEIRISAKLHHPNITEIYGVGKWNNLYYLEMEKIDGVSLKELIEERGALPVPVCSAMGIMICRALEYTHSHDFTLLGKKYRGMIHRDLKPSNIMLCKSGTVKLMDFGIARPIDESLHTIEGTFVGTIHYLPPEQLNSEPIDIRTDIYSFAATIYEALCGHKAFPEHNVSKLMVEKNKNHFKPLSEYDIKIPHQLVSLINRSMHSNPRKRYPDAGILRHKLELLHKKLTSQEPEEVIQKTVTTRSYERIVIPPRKHYLRNALMAAMILLALGLSTRLAIHAYSLLQGSKAKELTPTEVSYAIEQDRAVQSKSLGSSKPSVKTNTRKSVAPSRVATSSKKILKKSSVNVVSQDSQPQQLTEEKESEIVVPYDRDQLISRMSRADEGKQYQIILDVFAQLSSEDSLLSRPRLFKIRAFVGLKQMSQLKLFLATFTLDDGEYYLARARVAFYENKIARAEDHLDAALKAPCTILSRRELKQNVYFYKALCATKRFDENPTESNYKTTLGVWHDLKAEVKANPNNYYFKKAVDEMQRIGVKFRNNKG